MRLCYYDKIQKGNDTTEHSLLVNPGSFGTKTETTCHPGHTEVLNVF